MDRIRFDALARLVSTKHSRRTAMGSLLTSVLLGREFDLGLAKRRRKAKQRAKKNRRDKTSNQQNTSSGAVTPNRCYTSSSCNPGRGRNTSGCDFSGTSGFHNKNVRGANLSDSNYAGADMRGADFRGANLSDSCLVGADLLGAKLGGSVNLGDSVFCYTRMPDGSLNESGCNDSTACCQTTENAFAITVAYLEQFYPLWFTYNQFRTQSAFGRPNELIGPKEITPVYQAVVAINVDTLYASTALDLTEQPVIVTVPPTPVRYSVLTLDPYGNIFQGGLRGNMPGKFALVGPDYTGTLPGGVTSISLPLNFMNFIFRADTHTSTGEDQSAEAEQFRTSLQLQRLCDYLDVTCPDGSQPDTSGGFTKIVPVRDFAIPFKTVADGLIALDPIEFLKQLQEAVAAPNTPPLPPAVQELSDNFDNLFGNGTNQQQAFTAGAQAAHRIILDSYLSNRGTTNWIHFLNIGDWGDDVIDRSAITEFIQFGNGIDTAAYYHAFRDGKGNMLDGGSDRVYMLTFPPHKLPEASRFWSLTAYTPEAVELIPNPIDKYAVASYTPGLQFNSDNSLSVYMAESLPAGVPEANWLPVNDRKFNVMLRVYGPEGSVASNSYVPPVIEEVS